jgi:Flp pilus assembly protein TadG
MKLRQLLAVAWKRMRARAIFNAQASQLVEFAVALPLLVVFVVGIFDFSNAFTLKQRLTNIARDAARASAYDPGSDVPSALSTSVPISVQDAFQIVDNYLLASGLNDCGIGNTAPGSPVKLTWTYSASTNGCPPSGLQIVINRGYSLGPTTGGAAPSTCTAPLASSGVALISTCVSIQYPYSWRFGKVASLLGTNAILPTQITAVAVSMNEN